jgi:hypothetical protein
MSVELEHSAGVSTERDLLGLLFWAGREFRIGALVMIFARRARTRIYKDITVCASSEPFPRLLLEKVGCTRQSDLSSFYRAFWSPNFISNSSTYSFYSAAGFPKKTKRYTDM